MKSILTTSMKQNEGLWIFKLRYSGKVRQAENFANLAKHQ